VLQVLASLLAQGFTPQDLAFYACWAQEVVQHEHTLFSDTCQEDGEWRMENEGDEAKKVARYRRFRELVGPLQRLLYLSYLRRAIYEVLGRGKEDAR
jgi:hypothetical protein